MIDNQITKYKQIIYDIHNILPTLDPNTQQSKIKRYRRILERVRPYINGLPNKYQEGGAFDKYIYFNTHDLFYMKSNYPLMNYEFNMIYSPKVMKFKINEREPYRPDPNFMTVSSRKPYINSEIYIPEMCITNKKILRSILPAYFIKTDQLPLETDKREKLIQLCFIKNQYEIQLGTDYTQCLSNKNDETDKYINEHALLLNQKYKNQYEENGLIQGLHDFCIKIEELKKKKESINGKITTNDVMLFKELLGLENVEWTVNESLTKFLPSNVRPLQICLESSEGKRLFSYKIGDDLRNDAFVLAAAEMLTSIVNIGDKRILIETNDVIPFGKKGIIPITSKNKDTYGFITYYVNWAGGLSEYHKEPEQKGGVLREIYTFREIPVDITWRNFENKFQANIENAKDNFKRSLMGSILLQWIFGLHDRHSDNMGFLKDGQLANIDFNRIMNQFRAREQTNKRIEELKLSKDAIVDAPFIFSPDLAFVLAKCLNKEPKVNNPELIIKKWRNIPDFYIDERIFKEMFDEFTRELHDVIQTIYKERDDILNFIKLMSYTNNPRFLIQSENSLYKNRDYRGNRESRNKVIVPFEQLQVGGEPIFNTKIYSSNEEYELAKQESLSIDVFGYKFVEKVLNEFKSITQDQLTHKLWLSMRLNPYKVLFGVHEWTQDIKKSTRDLGKETKKKVQMIKDIITGRIKG